MEAFGRLAAIFLVIILVLLLPFRYIAEGQGETIDSIVSEKATEFTDTARHQGYISLAMYEDFIDQLDCTGELYDIEFEVSHPVSGKETNEAKADVTNTVKQIAFTNNVGFNYLSTINKAHTSKSIVRQTNASNNVELGISGYPANSDVINSFAVHTHTDDCYPGHRHSTYTSYNALHTHKDSCYNQSILCTGVDYNHDGHINYGDCIQQSYSNNYGSAWESGTKYICRGCNALIRKAGTSGSGPYSGAFDTSYPHTFSRTNPICGLEGTYSDFTTVDCYAPKLFGTVTSDYSSNQGGFSTTTAKLTCGECGANLYTFVLNSFYTYSYMSDFEIYQNNSLINKIMNYDANYSSTVADFNNLVISIQNNPQTAFGSGIFTMDAGKFIYPMPVIGYFPGCWSCNPSKTKTYCGQQEVPPVCDQVVMSISATNPTQKVKKGTSIITTANAVYLDGHTGEVNCTSNYNPNLVGMQTVTLTYTGLVNNAKNQGTKTCTVQVTVEDTTKLANIQVTPTSQQIARYQSPDFTVTASYEDKSNKIVTGYTVSGFDNTTLGTQTVIISYMEGGITKSATATVTVQKLTAKCSICGTVYELDENDVDHGCPVCASTLVSISASPDYLEIAIGEPFDVIVEGTYRNGGKAYITGWTSDFDTSKEGIQEVIISYMGKQTVITVNVMRKAVTCSICGREHYRNLDGSDPGCPYCMEEVVSIEVTPNIVTIELNESLPITVTATYRDGHTEEATDWTTDLNVDMPGTYNAAIYYKSASDVITVHVLDEGRVTCPVCGLNYVFSDNPNGCPVCSKTIVGIEADLRNGGTKVTYRANLDLLIVLNYKDGHQELADGGWTITDYNPERLGLQTVTVQYKEFVTNLTIEVIDNPFRIVCPIGHEYYLNEDGSDPGCPYCDQVDKGNSLYYISATYTPDILSELYSNKVYKLKEGDYLTVRITVRGTSIRYKISQIFLSSDMLHKGSTYTFGGEVIL